MTAGVRPPFRADQVGSLLRPAEIRQARAKVERGEMTAEALRGIEDHQWKKLSLVVEVAREVWGGA